MAAIDQMKILQQSEIAVLEEQAKIQPLMLEEDEQGGHVTYKNPKKVLSYGDIVVSGMGEFDGPRILVYFRDRFHPPVVGQSVIIQSNLQDPSLRPMIGKVKTVIPVSDNISKDAFRSMVNRETLPANMNRSSLDRLGYDAFPVIVELPKGTPGFYVGTSVSAFLPPKNGGGIRAWIRSKLGFKNSLDAISLTPLPVPPKSAQPANDSKKVIDVPDAQPIQSNSSEPSAVVPEKESVQSAQSAEMVEDQVNAEPFNTKLLALSGAVWDERASELLLVDDQQSLIEVWDEQGRTSKDISLAHIAQALNVDKLDVEAIAVQPGGSILLALEKHQKLVRLNRDDAQKFEIYEMPFPNVEGLAVHPVTSDIFMSSGKKSLSGDVE